MSGDVPETAITAACPDCGTELNDTDKNTAGLWCPRCARYHLPPSGKRDEAGQAAYEAYVAAKPHRETALDWDELDDAYKAAWDAALVAAAPWIVAAERERIRQLAIQHNVTVHTCLSRCHDQTHGIPFAYLLGDPS